MRLLLQGPNHGPAPARALLLLQQEIPEQPFLQQIVRKWEDKTRLTDEAAIAVESKTIYLDILDQQRKWLLNKNSEEATLNEEIIRKHLKYLDLEEEKLLFL